jgi:hypothetical protein
MSNKNPNVEVENFGGILLTALATWVRPPSKKSNTPPRFYLCWGKLEAV